MATEIGRVRIDEVKDFCKAHDVGFWTNGNIYQFRNVVKKAALLHTGKVEDGHVVYTEEMPDWIPVPAWARPDWAEDYGFTR